jgi:hypothetical protein
VCVAAVSVVPRYMWSRHCAAFVSGPVVTQTPAACPGGNGFDFRAASPDIFRVFAAVPAETYLKYAMTTSFVSHHVIRRYINHADDDES